MEITKPVVHHRLDFRSVKQLQLIFLLIESFDVSSNVCLFGRQVLLQGHSLRYDIAFHRFFLESPELLAPCMLSLLSFLLKDVLSSASDSVHKVWLE